MALLEIVIVTSSGSLSDDEEEEEPKSTVVDRFPDDGSSSVSFCMGLDDLTVWAFGRW